MLANAGNSVVLTKKFLQSQITIGKIEFLSQAGSGHFNALEV
jgi:hypothetical protein